jgi:hypothetical protein
MRKRGRAVRMFRITGISMAFEILNLFSLDISPQGLN